MYLFKFEMNEYLYDFKSLNKESDLNIEYVFELNNLIFDLQDNKLNELDKTVLDRSEDLKKKFMIIII